MSIHKHDVFLTTYLKTLNVFEAAKKANIKLKEKQVKRYYVYLLIDPRNSQIFYVGKGKGNRARQHLSDARAGRVQNSVKHDKIVEIQKDCNEVVVKIVEDNLSEQEAFQLERKYIIELCEYGLTNIVHGTVTTNERMLREMQIRLDRLETKEEFLASLNDYGRMVTTSACGSPEAFYDWFYEAHVSLINELKKQYEGK